MSTPRPTPYVVRLAACMHSPYRAWAVCIATLGLLGSGNGHAQAGAELVHGADSLFVTPDVAIVWAVLKQPASDHATVWLRIVNRTRKFSHVGVDGVDPFSKKRVPIEPGIALAAEVVLASDRDSFSDSPSREVHLYGSESDWRAARPRLTIYYLGVPDTTPEFSNRATMDAYLGGVRLEARERQARP